jgi:hypothetical protein
MDNVFDFRDELIRRYSSFSRSFVRIAAEDIRQEVERQYREGCYWPEPLIQITSVRLEVEQNQLVAGWRWIGIGETWLKGA